MLWDSCDPLPPHHLIRCTCSCVVRRTVRPRRMGAAFRTATAAVFSSSSSFMAGRLRRGWPLSPAALPLALFNSAWPSPLPRSLALVVSPSHLRLRGRVVARALLQDASATIFSFSGAYSLVRSIDALTERNLIQKVTHSFFRKLLRIVAKKLSSYDPFLRTRLLDFCVLILELVMHFIHLMKDCQNLYISLWKMRKKFIFFLLSCSLPYICLAVPLNFGIFIYAVA